MKLNKIIIPKKKKKGSIVDLLIWISLSFTIVIFFALWVFGFNEITTTLLNIDNEGSAVNLTAAAQGTFVPLNNAQATGLRVLAFVMIFVSALSILIVNFLIKAHPVFFMVYLFVIIAAFIASVEISNTYEDLLENDIFGDTLKTFRGSTFIMLFLPVWVAVIGIVGMIFLFSGISRDTGLGGGIS